MTPDPARPVVLLGAADGLVQVRADLARLATVSESEAVAMVRRIRRYPGTVAGPRTPDAYGLRTDRAARRARQFGRVLR